MGQKVVPYMYVKIENPVWYSHMVIPYAYRTVYAYWAEHIQHVVTYLLQQYLFQIAGT